MGAARVSAEVDVLIEQLLQPEVLGERGGKEEARVGDQVAVIEAGGGAVEAVRRSHLTGVLSS